MEFIAIILTSITCELKRRAGMETIVKKLPKWQAEIQHLYLEDEDFQEMCADYEEIHSLLANWTDPAEFDPTVIDEYTVLLAKIEAEIVEAVKTRFQTVQSSVQGSATQPDSHSEHGGDDEEQSPLHS